MDYGALYVKWAPLTKDEENSDSVKYGDIVDLGELMEININPTYTEAEGYGDNELREHISRFIKASVDLQVTELPETAAAAMFGADLDGLRDEGDTTYKGVRHNVADEPPYGGLAFITNKRINGVNYYKGYCLPKLKAVPAGLNFKSVGTSISLSGRKLSMVASSLLYNKDWMYESPLYEELDDAVFWITRRALSRAGQ